MKRRWTACCGAALLLWSAAAAAVGDWAPRAPDFPVKSYLLMDYHSGAILAEKDAGEPFEPASITKLMTAYVVYRALADQLVAMDDRVRISEKAWRTGGSRMFVEVGKEVALRDLVTGMVVQSGNDASVALAEHIAGTEDAFVGMMNETADLLKLSGSNFRNVSGLPEEGHYMTALDVATLSRAMIRDFPDHYRLYAQREFTYGNITQHNRNKLLWQARDLGVDGLKTGHTEDAGYCLAASAQQGDMRLVSVVLGSSGDAKRFQQTTELLRYGFRFYRTARLFEPAQALTQVRVWGGLRKFADLGLMSDFYVTYPKVSGGKVRTELSVREDVSAPVERHQTLGAARAFFADRLLREEPLAALEMVPQGGFFRRLSDGFMRLFE